MQTMVIIGIICLILISLFHRKTFKLLSKTLVKVTIGALCIFFLNLFSGSFGLHVPINLFTASLAGFLGIPGVIALSSLHLFIL
ncbi:pro-sigmaK processing inhibitor BofA family protein [Amphibacillus sediminis]|uniref:pro-sigmaK processing inhibitor BofA family protein n=1 Tax=Amphibacillus sediminis TaxID=360185 RepID=UPI000830C9E9|nr:pro-sigmaK processing inhibitor BofA family protein [Amphibacillus sediminis]